MLDDNNFEDQPSKLRTEVRAMDSSASNSPDFETNGRNFGTFVVAVVGSDEEWEAAGIDSHACSRESF